MVATGIYLDDVDATFGAQARLLAALVLAVMAIVVGMSLLISRSITRPVRRMTEAMARLADGELAVVVPERERRDEIGDMARAVQVFKDNALAMVHLRQEQERERLDAERKVRLATAAAERAIGEEISNLAAAFSDGDLTRRMSTEDRDGVGLAMSQGINRLAETVAEVIDDVVQVLEGVAEGDLTRRIIKDYRGAFDRLKADVNGTSVRLAEIVGQVGDAAEAISRASAEVASGSGDLADRTEQQASSLEETAASMEQLGSIVRTSVDHARHATVKAEEARGAAEQGAAVANAAITAMNQIARASRGITDIIGVIDVIDVIDDIAFQTNLLALNAAVEAARVGNVGAGFAVVAGEVRALAQRSATASKEIKALILNSDSQVRDGVELVRQAGDSLSGITAEVQQVAVLIGEIAAASAEQASTLDEINGAITGMDEMTQKNAAMVEQTTEAVRSMTGQVADLRQQMAVFKISTQEIGAISR